MAVRDTHKVGVNRRESTTWKLCAGASLAVLALLAPSAASAADAPAAAATDSSPTDTIVVTGIRYAIGSAIQIKRKEASVVEAVSAEEIGKLPDVSIAESIARLPGLAAQRIGGRASIISLRGFGPDFNTVLLNGRAQASSSYSRGVEFDQYPSELLSEVVVYKTPDADIAGQGLAGTVDMRTIRPLEYGKRAIAMNLRGELDAGGGKIAGMGNKGWRGSISYIDQNKDGTLGWSIGYAHLDAPSHTNHTKNWFYDNYGGPAYLLSGQEITETGSRDRRDGVMGTLEFRPSEAVHSTLDLYYSRFRQHTVNMDAQWFSDQWADGGTFSNVKTAKIGANTFGISDHFANAVPILDYQDNKRQDTLFATGLNNEFKLDDKTRFTADLSYSGNIRDETQLEAYGGYGIGPYQTRVMDSYDISIPVNGFPQISGLGLNYADATKVSLGDKAPWGGWGHDGLLKSPHIKETVAAGDFAISHDMGGFFSKIDVGVNYTHRQKRKSVDELDLFLKNGRAQAAVPSQFITAPVSLGFAGFGNILGVDIAAAEPVLYNAVQLFDANHYDKAWMITEDVVTLKAKANIESGHLHGNVGLQYVFEGQASDGLRINQTVNPIVVAPAHITANYHDFLPSLNLYYDLGGGSRIRLNAAKIMARPRMDDMRANMTPSFNSSICAGASVCAAGSVVHPWSASGGNPNLQPWRAKEVNLAYEWYGGKATYLSVSGFYMWVDNFIYQQALTADFSSFPLPANASSIPANVTISPIGQLTAPANGQGGYFRGVELSGAFELGKVSHMLDGFGMTGSVSYTDSHAEPTASTALGTFPGYSDWVYNITGYYEKNGFQLRANYRFRSQFKGEAPALFANTGFPQILADKQMDAQVGYTFPKGSNLEGLGILLQVNNLLDSPYRTAYFVNQTKTSPGTQMQEIYEKYGRQWMLGVSYHY